MKRKREKPRTQRCYMLAFTEISVHTSCSNQWRYYNGVYHNFLVLVLRFSSIVHFFSSFWVVFFSFIVWAVIAVYGRRERREVGQEIRFVTFPNSIRKYCRLNIVCGIVLVHGYVLCALIWMLGKIYFAFQAS